MGKVLSSDFSTELTSKSRNQYFKYTVMRKVLLKDMQNLFSSSHGILATR